MKNTKDAFILHIFLEYAKASGEKKENKKNIYKKFIKVFLKTISYRRG